MTGLILVAVLALVVFLVAARSIRIIPQSRVAIIQRLGRYHRTAESGLTFVVPVVDKMLPKTDLREQVIAFQPQAVITNDNVGMQISTVVYYQVVDARASEYEVANFGLAMEQITQTTLRNVIGNLILDKTLTSRDEINGKLRTILDEVTEKWGIRVTRVELKEITPPRDIQQAMEKQMQAERTRRAAILTAEGDKRSAILKSEGEKESSILRAEGEQRAAVLRADGRGRSLPQRPGRPDRDDGQALRAPGELGPLPRITALPLPEGPPRDGAGTGEQALRRPLRDTGPRGNARCPGRRRLPRQRGRLEGRREAT